MWKADARVTISTIIDQLRQKGPDLRAIILLKDGLVKELEKQNRFKETPPGDSVDYMNPKAIEVLSELRELGTALLAGDTVKARGHAESALQICS